MIPGSTEILHTESTDATAPDAGWQQEMARALRSPRQLLHHLGLSPAQLPQLDPDALDFPLRVPLPYVRRMEPGKPDDPLLLQVLPSIAEHSSPPGFTRDPLQEINATAGPGIIHKYHGRVLLIATGACAVHCRYCFRRHFPYQQHQQSPTQWEDSLDYIRRDPTISEVILSGGDPLILGNDRLQTLVSMLDKIPHLQRLRIHSRIPVVLPQRVDQGLLDLLQQHNLNTSVVIHSNHPAELGDDVAEVIEALRATGAIVLNQAVLLRNINDNVNTLAELSRRLFELGVLPYYLHLLDPVAGSAHFDVNQFTAREIYRDLLQLLPGYLVPKLVRENPAYRYKTPIPPC